MAYKSRVAQGLSDLYRERNAELKAGEGMWAMLYRSLSPEIPELLDILDDDEGAQEGTVKFLRQLGDIVREEASPDDQARARACDRIEGALEKLRDVDCVGISFCYRPHGDAVAVSLGEEESFRIVGSACGTTLEAMLAALENALS